MAQKQYFEISDNNKFGCNLYGQPLPIWPTAARCGDEQAHLSRFGYVDKLLRSSRPKIQSVLDVGCGMVGLRTFLRFHPRSRHTAFQFWQMDLKAEEDWLTGWERFWGKSLRLVKMDVLADEPAVCEGWPGKFDLVVCFELLNHIPRSQGLPLMQRLFRWTRPGGICLLSATNGGISAITSQLNFGSKKPPFREWTFDEKLKLVQTVGFEVEHTFGTYAALRNLPKSEKLRLRKDPMYMAARRFLLEGAFATMVAAANPKVSHQALFHLRKP